MQKEIDPHAPKKHQGARKKGIEEDLLLWARYNSMIPLHKFLHLMIQQIAFSRTEYQNSARFLSLSLCTLVLYCFTSIHNA